MSVGLIQVIFYVFYLLISTCGASFKAPSFIHRCNTTHYECLTRATIEAIPEFVKGIPEIGIPPLDPWRIDEMHVSLPGGVNFTLYDGKVTGFGKCRINNITMELGKYLETDANCDLAFKGTYKANGRLLLFPINGGGDAKMKMTNIHWIWRAKMKFTTDEEGVKHLVYNGYTYTTDYKGSATFLLKNLIAGNPEISEAVSKFINDNWRLVINEFGTPILDKFISNLEPLVGKFFEAVPYEEIFDIPLDESILCLIAECESENDTVFAADFLAAGDWTRVYTLRYFK